MNRLIRIYGAVCVLSALLVSAVAWASLKTWGSGETVRNSDLNGNFSTLNTTKVGGGVKLADTDVNTGTLSHTKLATPALVPKVWAEVGAVGAVCAGTPCTVTVNSGVTSVTRTSAGLYVVNFNARANVAYAPIVTALTATIFCVVTGMTTATATITCSVSTTGVATDSAFTFLLMDDA